MDNATYDYLKDCTVEEQKMGVHEAVENLDSRVKALEEEEE